MESSTALLLAVALLTPALPAPSAAQAPADGDHIADLVSLVDAGTLLDPIMSAEERARWQQLDSDTAREQFLQEFWDRRDPTPGTEVNEVRQIFLRRARRAQRMFAEGSTPGWSTDRGRVLLTYGLPVDLEKRSPDGGPAPESVWTYRGEPTEVRFRRSGDGYAAEDPPPFGNAAFLASTQEEVRLVLAAAFGGSVEGGTSSTSPSTSTSTAAGETGEDAGVPAEPSPADAVAPEVRIWMQLVRGGVSRDEIPLRAALRTFPTQEGTYTTLAFQLGAEALTFAIPTAVPEVPTGEQDAAALAGEAATETAAEEVAETQAEEQETPVQTPAVQEPTETTEPGEPVAELVVFGAFLQGAPGHETTVHQFVIPVTLAESEVVDGESPLLSLGVTLVPGTYRLAWGVRDQASGRAVTRDAGVEIPDFANAGLAITDPLLARLPHRTAEDEMSTQSIYRGIRLGNVLIDDDIDRTFGRDETIDVITVVTGWTPDPNQPGRPRLEVLYRVLEGDEDVSIARLQPQSLDFHVLGQQIPLSQIQQLEAGKDYRILIQVTDSVSGEMALRQVPFSVRADEEGESEG